MLSGTRSHTRPQAMAAAKSVLPMPVLKAATAPYVQVWLSAPTTTSPGATIPVSGSSTCSMPTRPTSK